MVTRPWIARGDQPTGLIVVVLRHVAVGVGRGRFLAQGIIGDVGGVAARVAADGLLARRVVAIKRAFLQGGARGPLWRQFVALAVVGHRSERALGVGARWFPARRSCKPWC